MADKVSIGGQALIEGVMMKAPEKYSVAVRKPDGTIDVQTYRNKKMKFSKIPVLRGMEAFVDSILTGYKSLMHATEIALNEEYEEDKFEKWVKKHFGDKVSDFLSTVAVVIGGTLALIMFMVIPTAITGFVDRLFPLGAMKPVLEGVIKLTVFLLYMYGISKMKDIKRVFGYHGAEHKSIACYESGLPLTVENVRKCTRFHPRCGTSFIFITVAVSIIVFSFVPWHGTFSRAILKVLFLPVVLGFSYEILRYTGLHDNRLTKILAAPGLWLQRITTNEPDDSMIEVGIASVNAVLPETIVKKEEKIMNAAN